MEYKRIIKRTERDREKKKVDSSGYEDKNNIRMRRRVRGSVSEESVIEFFL